MVSTTSQLAWMIQVEDEYGTRRIRAYVVVPQENGELHSPGSYRFDVGHEFRDFSVGAYLGESDYSRLGSPSKGGRVWGLGHEFKPHHIDSAERAREIASIFVKIERGMRKIEADHGYVKEGDFFTYLTRIANVLRVRTFYVRNHKRAREMSGEVYRKVNASALQYWIDNTSQLAEESPAEIDVRS